MVLAGDFRNGTTFEMDGNVYRIVEFQHVKPGKGAAFVRTKIKNIINNTTMEKTFKPCVGLKMGTIFPELVSPYVPCQDMEEMEFIRKTNRPENEV